MEIGGFEREDREKNEGERLDLPPEYCQYRDDGCELAGSCLKCPFKRCIHDEPGGKSSLLKKWRDREMISLFNSERKTVRELAEMFDVSTRTVQRALRGLAQSAPGTIDERRSNQDGE